MYFIINHKTWWSKVPKFLLVHSITHLSGSEPPKHRGVLQDLHSRAASNVSLADGAMACERPAGWCATASMSLGRIRPGRSRDGQLLEFTRPGKHTKSYWKLPIEIVDLPSYKMVIFHSYVSLPEGTADDSDDFPMTELNGGCSIATIDYWRVAMEITLEITRKTMKNIELNGPCRGYLPRSSGQNPAEVSSWYYERWDHCCWGKKVSVELPEKSGWILWFMVDTTIVFMGSIMVYKPTNITGGAHPAPSTMILLPTSQVISRSLAVKCSQHVWTKGLF